MTRITIDGQEIEVGPVNSPLRPGDNRVTQGKILRQLEREGVIDANDYSCEMLYISGKLKILAKFQNRDDVVDLLRERKEHFEELIRKRPKKSIGDWETHFVDELDYLIEQIRGKK